MLVQNIQDNSEIISQVEKEPLSDVEIITEKRTRGQRGPDKMPRKINLNSINNLKQYRKNTEKTSEDYSRPKYVAPAHSSKLFVGLAMFFSLVLLALIVYHIYKIKHNT